MLVILLCITLCLTLCLDHSVAQQSPSSTPPASTTPPAAAQPWFVFGSQNGDAPVMLMGSYRILGQTANRQGTFQEKPPDLWRMEINPTISLYGIPLTANLLLSSEQSGLRQDINAFSISLDPEAVKRIVTARAYRALNDFARSEGGELLDKYDEVQDSLEKYDPEKLKQLEQYKQLEKLRDVAHGDLTGYGDLMQQMGFMSDVESVMAALPTLAVGALFPTFTPLTVSGVRLDGGSAEWNPGMFYVHVAGGKTQRPLLRLDTARVDSGVFANYDNSAFGRMMYAGRLGIGRRDGAHLIFNGVYTIDDRTSIPLSDTNTALTPQKNMLAGLDFKTELIPGVWTLQGEGAVTLTVSDQNAPKFSTDAVPDILLGFVDSSASAYFDWALTGSTQIDIRSTGTRFRASTRRIGPGFRALGVPNLRTDVFRYDARVDQSFWQRQFSVGLFFRRDQDNLLPWKRSTTTITSIGATMGLNIRKYPYLRLSYAPYAQINNDPDPALQIDNNIAVITVASGYNYRIGSLSANTTVNVGSQASSTVNGIADYAVLTLNANQSVSMAFPLTLSAGLGYISQKAAGSPDNVIYTVDGSASYGMFDFMSLTGGLTLAFDDTYGTRTGFFFGLGAALGEYANIDIRAERNLFNERLNPPVYGGTYQETIFRASISRSW